MQEKLVDCYGVNILNNQDGGIVNFCAQIYGAGRFLIKNFEFKQFEILDKFFQKKIPAKLGIVRWHNEFFYQSDLLWENREFREYLLKDWLLLDKVPFLGKSAISKQDVIEKLQLRSEIYTKLQYIPYDKLTSVMLISFLFQTNGLIFLSGINFDKFKLYEKIFWHSLFKESKCAIVFCEKFVTFLEASTEFKIIENIN